jgi:hypothetical protein
MYKVELRAAQYDNGLFGAYISATSQLLSVERSWSDRDGAEHAGFLAGE